MRAACVRDLSTGGCAASHGALRSCYHCLQPRRYVLRCHRRGPRKASLGCPTHAQILFLGAFHAPELLRGALEGEGVGVGPRRRLKRAWSCAPAGKSGRRACARLQWHTAARHAASRWRASLSRAHQTFPQRARGCRRATPLFDAGETAGARARRTKRSSRWSGTCPSVPKSCALLPTWPRRGWGARWGLAKARRATVTRAVSRNAVG